MRIAITGHTGGIGRGLYNYFLEQGHTVLGFSRSNGYTMPENNQRILEQIIDCDIFINNSEPVQSQIFFVKELWPLWWDKEKIIIIVGSVLSKLASPHPLYGQAQLDKALLDFNTRQVTYDMKPGRRLIMSSIHPSFVQTNLHAEYGIPDAPSEVSLSVQEVVNIVDFILKSPVCVEEIVFRKK